MKSAFFENYNTASADFPYISCFNQNLNYFSHIHEEVEIIFVLSGNIEIICDNSCFTASENDICVFMPGEIHSFSSQGQTCMHIIKLQCKNSRESIDFSAFRIQNPINKDCNLYENLKKLFSLLLNETTEARPGYGYAANGISQQILCELIRSDHLTRISNETKKKHLLYITLLGKVNTFIKEHYKNNISIEDISTYCNFSPYYFSHLFKAATNTTFYAYLTAFRLDKSIPLLLYSDKKIIDISLECGFSTSRSFNRTFKKFFNQTPTEFKEKQRLHSL